MAERYMGRELTVIKISREGLCEENLVSGESKRISSKAEEAVLEKNTGENSVNMPNAKARRKSYQSKISRYRGVSENKVRDDGREGKPESAIKDAKDKRTSDRRSVDRQNFSQGRKRQPYIKYELKDSGIGADISKSFKLSSWEVSHTGVSKEKNEDDRDKSQADEETQEIHGFIKSAERDALYHINRSIATGSTGSDNGFTGTRDRAMSSGDGYSNTVGNTASNTSGGSVRSQASVLHDRPGAREFNASDESEVVQGERRAAVKKCQKKAVKKRYQRRYREANKGGIKNQIRETFGFTQGGFLNGSSGKKSEFIPSPGKGKLWKRILIVTLIFVVILFAIVGFALVVFQGGMTAVASTTYQSSDEDIHSTEEAYLSLEDALDKQINEMENTHPGYDEYRYQVDEINHNPFQLISYLTALLGEFTADDVSEAINRLFQSQYTLNVWETTETRTKTVSDAETGEETTETYEYHILNIVLTNHGIDFAARQNLTEDQYKLYEIYNSTSGNRAELFEDSQLPFEVTPGGEDGPTPEALSDEKFSRMYDEAKKYLGFPYVWGGSSPSTSFDCSGFVSWVINNSGNGWNVGRPTAEGLRSICSYVSADEARPGDLIFFEGTYNTNGASHVGIVIGDGKMIHCGRPVQITSYETPYWTKHFYQFGRIR